MLLAFLVLPQLFSRPAHPSRTLRRRYTDNPSTMHTEGSLARSASFHGLTQRFSSLALFSMNPFFALSTSR
jgi:hypothetical protein